MKRKRISEKKMAEESGKDVCCLFGKQNKVVCKALSSSLEQKSGEEFVLISFAIRQKPKRRKLTHVSNSLFLVNYVFFFCFF